MQYLLEGITVVDAASYVAGPGAATILGDFGANVIKVEPPGGDGYRKLVGTYPVPYHWLLTSRNKRSLAVDLSKEAGQKVIHGLVAKADVFTTNFLPKQLVKYDLQYEALKAINPRLIYAHVSGYGTQGEEANQRAFDVTGWWARSGLMEFIRDPGQTPMPMSPGMGDHCTATAFFGAIMSGLYRREKTGEGSFVSTSLVANGVWANAMALQGVIAGNDIGVYRQQRGWPNPFTDVYECSDGAYVVLAIINTAREYPQLLAALEAQHILEDNRFKDVPSLMAHRKAFKSVLKSALQKYPYSEVSCRLRAAGVTHGPVQPMAAILEDEQLRINNVVVETGDQGEGYELTINSPIDVKEAPKRTPMRAPDIGADTLDILREMDFPETQIQQLVADQVVFALDEN
ncbi:MAG: CoA transferase [Gammaproteobacteria bacterium]|nr:CoA transferase [Gammaproteobacteria bacterium]